MSTTAETLALLKGSYQNPLAKASNTVTTATGLVQYDLQAPAKNLYPVITILGKRLPRRPGRGGTATNWRAVTAITGSGWDSSGWVPEGQRAGAMSITAVNKAASYATLGEEGALTFEAQSAAEGFEDERSRTSVRVLQKAMLKEEAAILGGNASLQLGICPTPTLSAAGTGATLPAATYSVIGIALTLEGVLNSSVANGVATTKTVTGQDGQTFQLNGGASQKSTNATQVVSLGQTLTASVAAVQGALGYAWFVGTAGNEILQAITSLPTLAISKPLATGTQTAASITAADYSANPNTAFDGLLTTALKSGSGAYYANLAGANMTASGRGTVVEIDAMLKALWDNYRLSPTVLLVNSQEQLNITNKVLQGGSGSATPLLRQNVTITQGGEVVAGQVIGFYFNPFALGAGKMIPVLLHPNIPAGTILAWAEDLPAQYQSNEVPNVAEMHVRRDWYDIEWPLTTRSYQHGIYCEETLAVYAPFGMAVITGIGNG